jgi:hypothetical protein
MFDPPDRLDLGLVVGILRACAGEQGRDRPAGLVPHGCLRRFRNAAPIAFGEVVLRRRLLSLD